MIVLYGDHPEVGKDTVARLLMDKGFTRVAFADALYREVSEAYGIPEQELRGRILKENPQTRLSRHHCGNPEFSDLLGEMGYAEDSPMSPRWALRYWGAKYRRGQSENYWVNQLEKTLEKADFDKLVLTDARYFNEFSWAGSHGGVFVKLYTNGFPEKNWGEHDSDRAGKLWPPDHVIVNCFDNFQDLEVQVRDLSELVGKKPSGMV